MAEEADYCGRRRFAVACSVLSQCVRRAETAAASSHNHSRSVAQAQSPMLLMPGADVEVDVAAVANEEEETLPAQQLTIVYGGRVLVLDDVRADRAAEVMRVAALLLQGMPDLQVARKASLQRLLEKRRRDRRDRLRTRAPSSSSYAAAAAAVPGEQAQEEKDADRWLVLGIPGI